MSEKTFCMIKPDAVQAGKVNDIIAHLENAGFCIVKKEEKNLSLEQIEALYEEHKEKKFFPEIRDFIQSSPVVIMILEREDAVAQLRAEMGATNSADAADETIRGKWGNKDSIMENCIHGSDSVESADREIKIMFN